MRTGKKFILVILCSFALTACVGTIVGTAVDVVVEVAKVPFKVGGAVVDVVTGEDLDDQGGDDRSMQDETQADAVADEQFAL